MNGGTAWWGVRLRPVRALKQARVTRTRAFPFPLMRCFFRGTPQTAVKALAVRAPAQAAAGAQAWFAATNPKTAEAAILAPAPGYARPITDAVQLPVP